MNLELIESLSKIERKTLIERALKLQEEVGELAVEIGIMHQTAGFHHKPAGNDGVKGEAVDTTLVALSIFFGAGGTLEELHKIVTEKCGKWSQHQNSYQS